MITDGEKWHYLALKSEPIFYGGNGAIVLQKFYLNYLQEDHQIITGIFIV